MNAQIYALLSVLLVSLISFSGLLALTFNMIWARKTLNLLVSFAAGALLGDVFIHLIPELADKQQITLETSVYILLAIIAFFIMEKYVHWHHHHGITDEDQTAHHLVFANLFGDGVHNLIDGMIIGGAYLLDIKLGIATTVAVILHEIPQEFGDFGVLIYAGLSKGKALFYNFISALTALLGLGIALLVPASEKLPAIMASIAVGSFIYIAAADLIPETHKQKEKFWASLGSFMFGIVIMYLLLYVE